MAMPIELGRSTTALHDDVVASAETLPLGKPLLEPACRVPIIGRGLRALGLQRVRALLLRDRSSLPRRLLFTPLPLAIVTRADKYADI